MIHIIYFNDFTHTKITEGTGTVFIDKKYDFFRSSLGRVEAWEIL